MILNVNELYLYDAIAGSESSVVYTGEVVPTAWLNELYSLGDLSDVVLRINSPGGSVHGGWSIYNGVRDFVRLGHRVHVKIDGLAASIASAIALAGTDVQMAETSSFMIHAPRYAATERLPPDEQARMIAILDKIQGQIVDLYVAKTGQSRQQINAWVNAETWFTAQEAVDAGFVDGIYDERSALSATIDLARWIPAKVLARVRAPVDAVKAEMYRHSALTREARSHNEAWHHANICASAAEQLTRKAGATNGDLSEAVAVVERLDVFHNCMYWD